MNMKLWAAVCISCFAVCLTGSALAGDPIRIGVRRELLVDDYLIDRIEGQAALRLHRPTAREIVLVFDQPWEGNSCAAYTTVFVDGGRYRMFYGAGRQVVAGDPPAQSRVHVLCREQGRHPLGEAKSRTVRVRRFEEEQHYHVEGLRQEFRIDHRSLRRSKPGVQARGALQGRSQYPQHAARSEVDRRAALVGDHREACHHEGGLRLAEPGVLGSNPPRIPCLPARLSQRSAQHPHRDVARLCPLERAGVDRMPRRPVQQLYTNGVMPYYRARTSSWAFPRATRNAVGTIRCGRCPIWSIARSVRRCRIA